MVHLRVNFQLPDRAGSLEQALQLLDHIRRGQIVQRISAPGSLMARRESLIGPEVQGPIKVVHVSEGDRVEAGQLLLILEAMKMEHRITAPIDGVVSELPVQTNQQVANGELLVVVSEH